MVIILSSLVYAVSIPELFLSSQFSCRLTELRYLIVSGASLILFTLSINLLIVILTESFSSPGLTCDLPFTRYFVQYRFAGYSTLIIWVPSPGSQRPCWAIPFEGKAESGSGICSAFPHSDWSDIAFLFPHPLQPAATLLRVMLHIVEPWWWVVAHLLGCRCFPLLCSSGGGVAPVQGG